MNDGARSLFEYLNILHNIQMQLQHIMPRKMFSYKKNRVWMEDVSIVMQLGLTMAGCIMFCFFIGRYIDKWLGFRGIFVTVFIILGVVGGANVVYRQILEITEEGKDKKENNGGS